MDIAEFRRLGFLQEANRLFFHPLGLALAVEVNEDGERLFGVWDYRDDPEGVIFGDGMIEVGKVAHVRAERDRHAEPRISLLGYVTQRA